MSVLVGLQHVTRYRYDRPVALGPQIIRLRPAPHTRAHIETYSLNVTEPGRMEGRLTWIISRSFEYGKTLFGSSSAEEK